MRWPGNLFARRKTKDPDGWQVGDQAECINRSGNWYRGGETPCCGPQFGEVRVVTALRESGHPATGEPMVLLELTNWHGKFFSAYSFRKIRPRADALEAATVSKFSDLLPVRTPEKEDV